VTYEAVAQQNIYNIPTMPPQSFEPNTMPQQNIYNIPTMPPQSFEPNTMPPQQFQGMTMPQSFQPQISMPASEFDEPQTIMQPHIIQNFEPMQPPQAMERAMPQEAYEPATMPPDSFQQMTMPGSDGMQMAGEGEQASVLPIPAEYAALICQEDIDEIKASTGCEILVSEAEPGSENGSLNMTLLGPDDAREIAHRDIEDLLTLRVQEQQNQEGQAQYDEVQNNVDQAGAELVPCTILPIPIDLLKSLYNLDQIQEITGCTITTTPPQDGEEEWQLNLYGDDLQRQRAHQAIEDTLNAAMEQGGDLVGA
jgi:hypothetical protein